MGKFTGVLLASDFDNTLVYTEAALRSGTPVPELSPKNRAALEYFIAEGGRFAVATGRALPAFRKYAGGVPINAPCVVCNGAALYDFAGETYLETALLEGEVRQRVQTVLDRFPDAAVEAYHIDNVVYAVQPNEVTRHHARIVQVSFAEKATLTDVPLPLGKILFEGEHDLLEEVRAFLEQQSWREEYELIFSGKNLLELTAKGAQKGNMVCRLAEHLGIAPEHIYCAGDEANDVSMIAVAAQGFAPANCVEAVRESGATIVSNAWEHALADVVEILDRKYS